MSMMMMPRPLARLGLVALVLAAACASEPPGRYDRDQLAATLADPKLEPGIFVGDFVLKSPGIVDGDTIKVEGIEGSLRLLGLDAEDQRAVIGAGTQIGHRGERRDAARRARGLVPGGGGVPEPLVDSGRHGAQVTLRGEHLAERVGHVDDADVRGPHLRRGHGFTDHLSGQVGEVQTFPVQVTGEITLVAAKDPDVHRPHVTTTKRVTEGLDEMR